MGIGEEVWCFSGAGLIKEAEELGSVIGVDVLDGEGESAPDLIEEALSTPGGGGGVCSEDACACAGIDGGELVDLCAVGEAQVFGIHLDQGARRGLVEGPGRAFSLAFEAAEIFFPGFGREEVVLFDDASDGGGGEGDVVLLFQEDGDLVFAPGGELLSKGDDLGNGLLGQGR